MKIQIFVGKEKRNKTGENPFNVTRYLFYAINVNNCMNEICCILTGRNKIQKRDLKPK